jgi:hypothetical protein
MPLSPEDVKFTWRNEQIYKLEIELKELEYSQEYQSVSVDQNLLLYAREPPRRDPQRAEWRRQRKIVARKVSLEKTINCLKRKRARRQFVNESYVAPPTKYATVVVSAGEETYDFVLLRDEVADFLTDLEFALHDLSKLRGREKTRCVVTWGRFRHTEKLAKAGLMRLDNVLEDIRDSYTWPSFTNESKEGNLVDEVDGMDTNGILSTEVMDVGQNSVLNLNQFPERPILVLNTTLPFGTIPVATEIPLWRELSNDPTVRSKFRNFATFRGDIEVDITVVGMPFHLGAVMFSYQPYPDNNDSLGILSTGGRNLIANYLSQARIRTIMNVNENRTTSLKIPFVSPKPVHRLMNTSVSAITDVDSLDDFDNAGSLFMQILNPVESTSATPSDVSVQIRARFVNIELGPPTATLMDITLESGEYPMGAVSKALDKLMEIEEKLVDTIPAGTAATVSEVAMTVAPHVASIMGLSKPRVRVDPQYYKPLPMTFGATIDEKDTSAYMGLREDGEISIDPAIVYGPEDEMSISWIAGQESFLTYFQWSPTDSTLTTPIWTSVVHPQLCSYETAGANLRVQPTACAFAATPFYYWRGNMVFKFMVVCSKFHKGKLLIRWELNAYQNALIDTDVELNKQFAVILDLATSQSLEVEVDWANPIPWGKCVDAASIDNMYGVDFDPTAYTYQMPNGYLSVVPYTQLQSPDDSPVEVNVFVSCPDLRVNFFNDQQLPTERFLNESGYFEENKSDQYITKRVIINPTSSSTKNLSTYYFGEEPHSFGEVIKRYITAYKTSLASGAPGDRCIQIRHGSLPVPNPTYTALATQPLTILGYLAYAYLAKRGSMRYRAFIQSLGNATSGLSSRAVAFLSAPTAYSTPQVNWTTSGPQAFGTGAVSFVVSTNGAIEFEVPFYSNNLFMFSCTEDGTGIAVDGEMSLTWLQRFFLMVEADYSSALTYIDIDMAAGETFRYVGFLGAPHYIA